MQIDRKKLEQDLAAYLASPEGNYHGGSGVFGFVIALCITVLAIVMGLALIITIIGFSVGSKALWYGLSLEAFRGKSVDVSRAIPVIAHGIIASASEKKSVLGRPGLVLATFEDERTCPPDELSQMAAIIGRVYSKGAKTSKEQALQPLTEDDEYKGERATRVPEPWSKDRVIFTWACVLNTEIGTVNPQTNRMVFAFIGNPHPGSMNNVCLEQIPWDVVKASVTW